VNLTVFQEVEVVKEVNQLLDVDQDETVFVLFSVASVVFVLFKVETDVFHLYIF